MKCLQLLFFVAVLSLAFGCEEIAPEITSLPTNDTTKDVPIPDVSEQPRQVLIEEFTGVSCVNCPAGSAVIEELLTEHGTRLVAVSIHSSGNFSTPLEESIHDFRTSDGDNLLSFLGEPIGYPTAVVDRHLFEGEIDLQLFKSQWPGFIEERLSEAPTVQVGIGRTYDEATRELCVSAGLFVLEDIEGEDVRITVAVLENDVEDAQVTPEGKKLDYKHKHILRDVLSAPDGNLLTEPLTAGSEITRNFSVILPDDYVAENCTVIAFVNRGGDSKEVLQAEQVSIFD